MNTADRVDRWLWQRGFPDGPVRTVIRNLVLVSTGLLILGTLLLPLIHWPFWLGVGAALSTWNFYSLAVFVQRAFPRPGAGSSTNASRAFLIAQLLRSNLRLFITGILVYISLVVFRANPFALVAGLSATVCMIPALLLIRRGNGQ